VRGFRVLVATLAVIAGGERAGHAQAAVGLLHPAPGAEALLAVPAAACAGHLAWQAGVGLDYARDVLVGTSSRSSVARPVADRVATELWGTLGLFERFDLAVALPAALSQRADRYAWSTDAGGAGLGDLRVLARASALRTAAHAGFGLATQVELTVPTATGAPLLGEDGVTITPWLLADWRSAGGVLIALRAGYLVRRATRFEDLRFDDEVRVGLGTELPLGWQSLSALAELASGAGLGDAATTARRLPVEVAGAVRWRSAAGVVLTLGAGSGLSEGYGAPSMRAFVAIAVGPGRATSGPVAEAAAAPPTEVPVPVPLPVAPLSAAAFDRAVADQPDADRDGLVASADRCPDRPEDRDGFDDDDGCPDPDNDGDGVPDTDDRCPREAEVVNGVDDGDGCPDQGTAAVTVTTEAIRLDHRVQFATGSAEVRPESLGLLAQVAAALKAHPEIRKVRVDGHTDDVGDREQNVDLSLRRAERVVSILIDDGVAPARLEAKGFGPKVPLAPNVAEANRAQNRRVEFTILGDHPGEAAP